MNKEPENMKAEDFHHQVTLDGTFNTGRGYTREGQIIEYRFFENCPLKRYAVFWDRSRMISGMVYIGHVKATMRNIHAEIQKGILAQYDFGLYAIISNFSDFLKIEDQDQYWFKYLENQINHLNNKVKIDQEFSA